MLSKVYVKIMKAYSFISWKSISPLPSTSYILNAQASFSSGVPAEVTWSASMNSLKSIVPLLSVSKVLKTFSLNFSAFPPGNILEYISTNCVLVSSPSGQSSRNPWYHSWGRIQIVLYYDQTVWPDLMNCKLLNLKFCLKYWHSRHRRSKVNNGQDEACWKSHQIFQTLPLFLLYYD